MAAYEVLLLNTAIPQIQAAQSGDTYVVPRDIAFSAALTLSAGTANGVPYLNGSKVLTTGSALVFDGLRLTVGGSDGTNFAAKGATKGIRFDFDGTTSTIYGVDNTFFGSYEPLAIGGSYVTFKTSGTEQMRLTSTGLGIGTSNPAYKLDVQTSAGRFQVQDYGAGSVLLNSNGAMAYKAATTGHQFFNAATQAMTLDASGRLLVGVTSGSYALDVGDVSGGNMFRFTRSGVELSSYISSGLPYFGTTSNTALLLMTNNAERARITSGGYFKASDNGTYTGSTSSYHESYNTASNYTHVFTNTNASPVGPLFLHSTDSNGTANEFWYCQGNATQRAALRSNGGLANYQANDVNLSDQRTKKDIVAAPSYWDKIKGIEIVHFKYKDQTHDDNNVGVIAQQVEQVAPEFVDQDGWGETPEDGVPLKSIYTSDMYHAAIKALQEAMARIETLEAEVAALKGA